MCLSLQNTSFVATKVSLSWQKFCHIIVLWQLFFPQQAYFCHNKHVFVMTNVFVATKVYLSQQNVCCDKHVFLQQNICHDKNDTCGSSRQLYIDKNGDDELQSQQLWLLSSKTKNAQAAEAAQAVKSPGLKGLIKVNHFHWIVIPQQWKTFLSQGSTAAGSRHHSFSTVKDSNYSFFVTGEVNISVDCNGVEPSCSPRHSQRSSHNNPRRQPGTAEREASTASCSCQEVEEQILRMAKEAYRNIRRRDATPAAFEQFRKELQQTNAIVKGESAVWFLIIIIIIIITKICKTPSLRLKALNKHAHIMYIKMENVIQKNNRYR